MIQNKFIYEINFDIDINYLRKIIEDNYSIPNMPKHHRLVKNDSYLTELKEKFPFLSPVFNVYKFEAGRVVAPHIDGDRFCAINIPILNTENSYTSFYKVDNNAVLDYDEQRILYEVKGNISEEFTFKLSRPTLINTTIPHGVKNNGDSTRIIMSWSVLKPLTFDECSNILKDAK